jgi:hypothetical protein
MSDIKNTRPAKDRFPMLHFRRLAALLGIVAAIGGGALLTGCGGGGDSGHTSGESGQTEAGGLPGVSKQQLEEAEEKIENGEGPSQQQIEEAAAAVKKQFENGEGPGQKEIEELTKQGEELTEESMEAIENGEEVDPQKLKEVERQAEEFEEGMGE